MKIYISLLVCALALVAIAVPADAFAGICTPNAQAKCVSNISYWYDSCGALQSIKQNCSTTNQVCQSGACVNKTTNPPSTGYVQNYRTACYNNNLHWYDSNGAVKSLFKNCADTNSCTVDSCASNQCANTLKCDGSTCATNSADYATYCQNQTPGTPGTPGPTASQVRISILAAKESEPTNWGKFINAAQNDKLNFLVLVKNSSTQALSSASVTADITSNISYTGNLKIDTTLSAGNITSGIELGSIPPNSSKLVTFTGTVQGQGNNATSQVTARVTSGGMIDNDSVIVNIASGQTGGQTASVSDSPFVDFVKKWYLWFIIIAVLIALFIIIFRRLSTNV